MSNIHYISDLPQKNDMDYAETHSILRSDQETSSNGCVDVIFPCFAWDRFILWCSVIQAVIFVISLCIGSSRFQPYPYVLYNLGASSAPAIQRGQLWRLITPLLLHASLWHLLINLFFQLHLGFAIERAYGLTPMTFMYLLHGAIGVSFSLAVNPCIMAVGCSTAGFGLFGVSVTESLLGWRSIPNKTEFIINIILCFCMTLLLSLLPGTTIDWAGHIGGLLSGVAFAFAFSKIEPDALWFHRIRRPLGIGILIMLPSVCLTVIFLSNLYGPNGRCV